ncbi:hypothetical protein MOV61_06690, partial [Neorhizobium sp. BETTINA12A]|nr:hypothetical protein [Neorhizobium sp. BETTINA12A]
MVVDGLLGRGALAAEQGLRPSGFGTGGAGLGGGTVGRTGTGQSTAGGTADQAGGGSGAEALE